MKPLDQSDSLHLQAAVGWLELGNHTEANEELEHIAAQLRAHPDVLEVRWQIYAAAKKWEVCLEIATTITKLFPERAFEWIHLSYALHELKRTKEARDNLLGVLERFPANAITLYNLACYECQLGRLKEAKRWLEMAFKLGGTANMKLMALDDEDLQPLWEHIGELKPPSPFPVWAARCFWPDNDLCSGRLLCARPRAICTGEARPYCALHELRASAAGPCCARRSEFDASLRSADHAALLNKN